jgi:hypothetical protein
MTPDDTDALHAGTGATDLSSADQLASHDGTAVFGDDVAAMAAYADDPTAYDDDVVVTDDAGTGFDATALDASYDGASHDIGAYDDGAAFDHAGYDDGAAFDHSGYDDGAAYDHAPYDEPAYEHSGYDDDDAYDFAIDA